MRLPGWLPFLVFVVSNTTERPSLGETATVFLLANPAQGDYVSEVSPCPLKN